MVGEMGEEELGEEKGDKRGDGNDKYSYDLCCLMPSHSTERGE